MEINTYTIAVTDEQFYTLAGGAVKYADRDAYISDYSLSSIWGDADDAADIPSERIELVAEMWDICHLSLKDIRAAAGLTQAAFSRRFLIPTRTIEDWEAGQRECRLYLRLLLAEAVGLFRRVSIK